MTSDENRLVATVPRDDARELSDEAIVLRVKAGETGLFRHLLRRYNQRVYHAARAVLRDDAEAEDVAQEAWVRAYQHLRELEGRALFPTWITRIAFHEALATKPSARSDGPKKLVGFSPGMTGWSRP